MQIGAIDLVKDVSERKPEALPRFVKKLRPSDGPAVELTGDTRLRYDGADPPVACRRCSCAPVPDYRPIGEENRPARGIDLSRMALPSEKSLDEALSLPFDEIARIELRVIGEQVRGLNRSIGEPEKTIAHTGSKLQGHRSLRRMRGIGRIAGAIWLSVACDVNNVHDERRPASSFGVLPRASSSKGTEGCGRMRRRGTRFRRTSRAQSALIAASYRPDGNHKLSSFLVLQKTRTG